MSVRSNLENLSTLPPLQGSDVQYRENARAQRYIVRVDEDAKVIVTVPSWGSEEDALAFVNSHREWIETERLQCLTKQPANPSLTFGSEILFRGFRCELRKISDWGRPFVVFASEKVALADESSSLARPIARHLRALAAREFPSVVSQLAREHQVAVSKVSIRDQKTRWGSCSTSGAISLNWRLILAPDETLRYVVLHELAHRRHFNHSKRFWRLVEQWCPHFREHEKWLDEHQGEMRW